MERAKRRPKRSQVRAGEHEDDVLSTLLTQRGRFAAFLAKRAGDPATAEDILQGAFTKILTRRAAPADRSRVVPWFFRVLRRELVDHGRRAGARRRAMEGKARISAREETTLRAEVCGCVTALVQTLSPEHRDILTRVEVAGDSVRDTASTLGITANAAAVRAHRARAALLERVRDLCGVCAEHRCLRCRCDEVRGGPGKRR